MDQSYPEEESDKLESLVQDNKSLPNLSLSNVRNSF